MRHINNHHIIFALSICLILFLFSRCKNEDEIKYLNDLKAIQNMGDSLPSIAIDSLKKFNIRQEAPSKYALMKKNLLEIRLRDKNFMEPSSDDSIKRVFHYFENKGTAGDLVEVYYYMGSTYRDLNDSPRAVDCFLTALDLAGRESAPDTMLMINTCSQLASIYNKLYQYKDEQDLSLEEFKLAKQSGDLNPRIIMDVYTSYISNGDSLKAYKYGDMALHSITSNSNFYDCSDIVAELLYDYTKGNRKSQAEKCLKFLKSQKVEGRPVNYYLAMATYYTKYSSTDSAISYLQNYYDMAQGGSAKYYASILMLQYYANKKDIDKIINYANLVVKHSNSWTEKAKEEQTVNAKNYFKYQRDKQAETELVASAERSKRNLVVGIMLFMLIIVCLVAFYLFKKKKALVRLMSIQKDVDVSKQQIVQKDKELREKRRTLTDMERKIDVMDMEIRHKDEELKLRMEQSAQLMKVAFMGKIAETNNDIITKFKSAADGQYSIQEADWKDLFAAVNALYPGFVTEIQMKIHRISEPLIRICYLLKIGMTNPQIEKVTNYPHQTVWRRVKKATDSMGDSLLFNPSNNISNTEV